MADICIVVADSARARLFRVETAGTGKTRLAETDDLVNPEYQARGAHVLPTVRSTRNTSRQSGPMHPYEQKRGRHRLELEKRFAHEVAAMAAARVAAWSGGSVALVAEPRMLGLLREAVRGVLKRDIRVKELAKDYTQLTPAELQEQLAHSGLISSASAQPAQS